MLGVTLFGIFLTPVFFYALQGRSGRREIEQPAPGPDTPSATRGPPIRR
jgi:hypothetical protein